MNHPKPTPKHQTNDLAQPGLLELAALSVGLIGVGIAAGAIWLFSGPERSRDREPIR